MVILIEQACTLISQVRKNGITISEDLSAESGWGTHTKDFTLRLPQRVINRIDQSTSADGNGDNGKSEGRRTTVAISPHAIIIPTPPRTASPSISLPSILDKAQSTSRTFQPRAISPTTALLQADVLHAANGLIAELSVWDKSSNFTPFHPRTQYGNHTYRHAIKIRLLREVFMVPMDDARVQDSVRAIVELTVELLAQYGRITWYVLLITHHCGDASRRIWLINKVDLANRVGRIQYASGRSAAQGSPDAVERVHVSPFISLGLTHVCRRETGCRRT